MALDFFKYIGANLMRIRWVELIWYAWSCRPKFLYGGRGNSGDSEKRMRYRVRKYSVSQQNSTALDCTKGPKELT